jgi:hypothetical protein
MSPKGTPSKGVIDIALLFASAVIGYLGLSSPYAGHSKLLLLIPIFWCIASRRYAAFLVFFIYNITAARGLLPGAAVFLSENYNALQAFLLWLSINIGVSLPFLLFWHTRPSMKALCFMLAFLFAYIIPPISLIGIINPAIGGIAALLPGSGFIGISLIFIIVTICCFYRIASITFFCVIMFSSFFPVYFSLPPQDFYAIDTSYGRLGSGSFNFANDFDRAMMVFTDLRKRQIRRLEQRYILLPETVAGRSNEAAVTLWTKEIDMIRGNDQVFFWGGEIPTAPAMYDNGLFMYDGRSVSFKAQRIPVPYSMYRPFTNTGANLHYFSDGILSLPDGKKALVLICYETFLTWPLLFSMSHKPDIIIAVSNLWWCRDTSIPDSQERFVSLWGRLFNLPVVFAVNI